MTAGRPTKYEERFCQMLIQHMSEGLSFDSFAAEVKINRDTLYEWKKVYPEFSDAHKRGLVENLNFWERVGRQQAIKGKGNVAAWIFNMKNRHGWKDTQEITSPDGQAPIQIIIKERNAKDD